MATHPNFRHAERGSALIVGLIFLVVITLIGITAMSSTVLQERMTGGQRNESLAFNGSESALRGAELSIWKTFGASSGLADPPGTLDAAPVDNTGAAAAFRATGEWSAAGTTYTNIDYDAIAAKAGGAKLDRDPHYLIEKLGAPGSCPCESNTSDGVGPYGASGSSVYYRITARSTGGDARVRRTTESIYAVGN
jgi:type IV pilus assembly protein PilX